MDKGDDMSEIFIDVKIPWEPNKRLGYAINRAMDTVEDNVLILDHDVFLSLNPHWYQICQNAIDTLKDKKWGWITCITNQIGCPIQKADYSIEKGDFNYSKEYDKNDMNKHFELAEMLYNKNKGKIEDITKIAERWKLSGMFILTNKKAYDDVKKEHGFPNDKFIGWDNYYNDRLLQLGYSLHLMKDLYVYHGYKRLWKNGTWGTGMVGNG